MNHDNGLIRLPYFVLLPGILKFQLLSSCQIFLSHIKPKQVFLDSLRPICILIHINILISFHKETIDSTSSPSHPTLKSSNAIQDIDIKTVMIYLKDMEQAFNQRLSKFESQNIVPSAPPIINTKDDLWNYIFDVEKRLQDRMEELEKSRRKDFSSTQDLLNSLPGGSPQVRRYANEHRNVNDQPVNHRNINGTNINDTNADIPINDTNANDTNGNDRNVNDTPCPAKRSICGEIENVTKRLRQDKETVTNLKFLEPMDIELDSNQYDICTVQKSQSVSCKNFAARVIMELFDHRLLVGRNMNGKAGKGMIPDHIKKTILKASWRFYPEEMRKNPPGQWKEIVTAIDSRLRNSSARYKNAKLNVVS